MSRFGKVKLAAKMGLVAAPLALVGVLLSDIAVSEYKESKPTRIISAVTQNGLTAVLSVTTNYYSTPPEGYATPTTCPTGYTGTPPNCQPTSGSTSPTYTPPPTSDSSGSYTQPSSGSTTTTNPPPTYSQPSSGTSGSGSTTTSPTNTTPTTCPAPYTGTPPNCQAPAGSSTDQQQTTTPYQNGSSGSGSSGQSPQNSSQYIAPPTYSRSDSGSCMEKILGAEAYAKFQSGGFNPTPDQMAKASSCFSANVSYGSPPNSGQGSYNSGSGQSSGPGSSSDQYQSVFSSIAIIPPPAFQPDSPMVACAKSIVGDRFGSQPSPDQMARIQAKCFAGATSGQHIGFIDSSGQNRSGPVIAPDERRGERPGPPALPPEVKACVLKAGMSEATIEAISRGQSPTAAQQQQGEGCFSQYAKDKGYIPPMLTPPDPTQPFDPNSKQNQCADLVAQTHGIRFNQINPGIVAAWSAGDVGKLRSCYGVSPASSAGNDGSVIFAPTSPQVAISNTKLTCIEQAVGSDKLAAVIAGTSTMSETDRRAVYNKCINPTKIAAGADPALLGVLAAMPPSDLESQFIPIDSEVLPAPTAAGTTQTSADAEVTIGGEVKVATAAALPTKVDVFVKSTTQTFTVALKKVTDTKATWSLNVGQNKLPLGDHKAYAVATLADATQTRSPDASFTIAAIKAAKDNTLLIAGASVAAAAGLIGAWFGWRWHKGQGLPSLKFWHRKKA